MGKINLKEKKSKSYNFNLWSSYLSSHQKRILSCIKNYMKSLIYTLISNSFWLLMKESGKVKKFPSLHSLLLYFLSHSLFIADIAQMLVNFLISPALEVQVSLSRVKERRMTLDYFEWQWMALYCAALKGTGHRAVPTKPLLKPESS